MTFIGILKLALLISITLNVLALALRVNASDVLHLFREWRLGARAFGVMFVVVPALAVLMAYTLDLKAPVKVALVALALSPVPPILPMKQLKGGATARYVTGLLMGASLLALVVTPVGLEIVSRVFGRDLGIAPAAVARILAIGIAAPLVVGFVGRRLLGARADKASVILARISSIMLLACLLGLIAVFARPMWTVIGDGTLAAVIAMILAGFAAGYLLAGDIGNDRVALSLAAATRHPGVALAIASANFPGNNLIPAAIVLYALTNMLLSIPYQRWLRSGERAG